MNILNGNQITLLNKAINSYFSVNDIPLSNEKETFYMIEI